MAEKQQAGVAAHRISSAVLCWSWLFAHLMQQLRCAFERLAQAVAMEVLKLLVA